jgi:hypothetical protein
MEHPSVTVGSRFLGPTGRIWTVRRITPRGHRLVMVRLSADKECAAVMDVSAVLRMVPLDRAGTARSGRRVLRPAKSPATAAAPVHSPDQELADSARASRAGADIEQVPFRSACELTTDLHRPPLPIPAARSVT